ncbi:hypothetical protein [Haloferula sp.]|uniref:hypothetical protein n=1 Tax=Haloferula sp. TaxID=2497595 RepID=UPI003C7619A3
MRYQLPGSREWISNEGEGHWLEEQRELAQLDGVSRADLPNWIAVERRGSRYTDRPEEYSRERIAEELAYLDLLIDFRDYRAPRQWLELLLKESVDYPDEWKALAIKKIMEQLNRAPGQALGAGVFVKHCLELLERPTDIDEFGSVESHPEILWSALVDVASQAGEGEEIPWERIFEVMRAKMPKASDGELGGMARLGWLEPHFNEWVDDDLLVKGAKSDGEMMRAMCISKLMERKQDALAVAVARTLEQDDRFMIMKIMLGFQRTPARYGSIPPDYTPAGNFYMECVKEDPQKAFDALYEGLGRKTDLYFPPSFSLEFRPFVQRLLIENMDEELEVENYRDRERLTRTLKVFLAQRTPYNLATLRKLMSHKAYYVLKVDHDGETVLKRIHFVAAEARRQLLLMGEEL